MRTLTLTLCCLVTSYSFANQIDESELSAPTVELVSTIHEFCLEQQTNDENANIDNQVLNCVNADLEIATYKTFKSYNELISFISQETGE